MIKNGNWDGNKFCERLCPDRKSCKVRTKESCIKFAVTQVVHALKMYKLDVLQKNICYKICSCSCGHAVINPNCKILWLLNGLEFVHFTNTHYNTEIDIYDILKKINC